MTLATKPVKRETLSSARSCGKVRPMVIEINTTFVRIRLKGMKSSYTVSYDQIFSVGAQNEANERRRERLAAKKARARA